MGQDLTTTIAVYNKQVLVRSFISGDLINRNESYPTGLCPVCGSVKTGKVDSTIAPNY